MFTNMVRPSGVKQQLVISACTGPTRKRRVCRVATSQASSWLLPSQNLCCQSFWIKISRSSARTSSTQILVKNLICNSLPRSLKRVLRTLFVCRVYWRTNYQLGSFCNFFRVKSRCGNYVPPQRYLHALQFATPFVKTQSGHYLNRITFFVTGVTNLHAGQLIGGSPTFGSSLLCQCVVVANLRILCQFVLAKFGQLKSAAFSDPRVHAECKLVSCFC
jgi:hypothetical protein